MDASDVPSADLARPEPQKPASQPFYLERVYTNKVALSIVAPTGLPAEAGPLVFGWDWWIRGTHSFVVAITLGYDASKLRQESVRVSVLGQYEIRDNNPKIKFADFLRVNAPVMLMPYARELLSSVTRHGFYGAYILQPVNVIELMRSKALDSAKGTVQIRSNSDIASGFIFAEFLREAEASEPAPKVSVSGVKSQRKRKAKKKTGES